MTNDGSFASRSVPTSWSGVRFRRRRNVPASSWPVTSRSIAMSRKARGSRNRPSSTSRPAMAAAVSPAVTVNSTSVVSLLAGAVIVSPRSSRTSSATKGSPSAPGLPSANPTTTLRVRGRSTVPRASRTTTAAIPTKTTKPTSPPMPPWRRLRAISYPVIVPARPGPRSGAGPDAPGSLERRAIGGRRSPVSLSSRGPAPPRIVMRSPVACRPPASPPARRAPPAGEPEARPRG